MVVDAEAEAGPETDVVAPHHLRGQQDEKDREKERRRRHDGHRAPHQCRAQPAAACRGGDHSDDDAEQRGEAHREPHEQHALRIGIEQHFAHRPSTATEDRCRRGLAEGALQEAREVVLRALPGLDEDVEQRRVVEAAPRCDKRDLREGDDENEGENNEQETRDDRDGGATQRRCQLRCENV